MPGTKRKNASKRLYTKRYAKRARNTVSSIQSSVSLYRSTALPTSLRTTLRYCDTLKSLNPGIGGTAASQVWSCNGLFDPDISGVGHQCAGFDEIMTFYDHYTVLAAKIFVNFKNIDSGNGQFCAIYISDDNAPPADIRVVLENGNAVYKLLASSGSWKDSAELMLSVDIAKHLQRNIKGDPDLRGTNASNPVEDLNFVCIAAPQSAVDSQPVVISTIIEYDVLFTERRRTPLS